MLFVLFALWIIALGLVMVDPQFQHNALDERCCFYRRLRRSCGCFVRDFIPYIQQTVPNPSISALLYRVMGISSLLSYYGLPYSFAMLSLSYNASWQKPAIQTWLPLGLLTSSNCLHPIHARLYRGNAH